MGVVAFLLFGVIGYDALGVYMWTEPVPRTVCCQTPGDYGLVYEEVSLDSCDDTTLAGWYLPSQNGAAVIMLHGYGGTRLQVLPQAAMLGNAGYGVLLYPKELWNIPDVGHGDDARAHTQEYAQRLVSFFDQAPPLTSADSGR